MTRIVLRSTLAAAISFGTSLPVSGQDYTAGIRVQAAAIAKVAGVQPKSRIVLVPRDEVSIAITHRVAAILGVRATQHTCGKSTQCSWVPGSDTVAIGADIIAIDDTSAVVRIVTWGRMAPSKGGPELFAAGETVFLRKVRGNWVVTSSGDWWET